MGEWAAPSRTESHTQRWGDAMTHWNRTFIELNCTKKFIWHVAVLCSNCKAGRAAAEEFNWSEWSGCVLGVIDLRRFIFAFVEISIKWHTSTAWRWWRSIRRAHWNIETGEIWLEINEIWFSIWVFLPRNSPRSTENKPVRVGRKYSNAQNQIRSQNNDLKYNLQVKLIN